jgi:hypothetical protein
VARARRKVLVAPAPLRTVADRADALEPNDDQAHAAPLPLGVTRLVLGGGAGTDEDWFRVDIASGQELRLALGFTHAQGDVDVQLLDAAGSVAAASTGTSDVEQLRLAPRRGGRFFVRVYGGANVYHLVADLAPLEPADRLEPNDRPEDAAPLAPGEATGLVSTGQDWYRLDVGRGLEVEATIDFDHERGDLDLEVADPAGQVLASSRGVLDQEQVTTIAPAGGLLVHVYGGPGAPYRLRVVTRPPPPADRLEPNDAPDAARPLGPGEYQGLVADPTDWYRLDAPPGRRLRVTAAADRPLDLALARPAAPVVALRAASCSSPSAPAVVELATRRGAPLLLRVRGGSYVPYRLAVEVLPLAQGDEGEPDDLQEDATPIRPGTLLATCEGEDWYTISVGAGLKLHVTVAFRHAQGDIDVALVDASGEVLASSTGTTDEETIDWTAPASGPVWLRVYTLGAANPYTLSAAILKQ